MNREIFKQESIDKHDFHVEQQNNVDASLRENNKNKLLFLSMIIDAFVDNDWLLFFFSLNSPHYSKQFTRAASSSVS